MKVTGFRIRRVSRERGARSALLLVGAGTFLAALLAWFGVRCRSRPPVASDHRPRRPFLMAVPDPTPDPAPGDGRGSPVTGGDTAGTDRIPEAGGGAI